MLVLMHLFDLGIVCFQDFWQEITSSEHEVRPSPKGMLHIEDAQVTARAPRKLFTSGYDREGHSD